MSTSPDHEVKPAVNTVLRADSVRPRERGTSIHSELDVLGKGMKEMVEIINRLRAAGVVQNLGMPLPRIAVLGNQSAGKSSLIEAISGIKVPRYTGTCTRCPLEISLGKPTDASDTPNNSNSRWVCKTSLRLERDYFPANGTPNPWVEGHTRTVPFQITHDKAEVENILVCAQTAVLNPSRAAQEFLPGAGGAGEGSGKGEREAFEVKFSPNVVCVEITGPELPELSFIDLPGVIQTTESKTEEYLIGLVEGLVRDYIRQEDCLILLAMTMRDDAVNQTAARLARELGEDRIIGALTKPDTIFAGEYDQWVKILRGESHQLKHGYFVTKHPNQEQLAQGIDNAQARMLEKQFFESTAPWNTLELADKKDRFGTPALASYLSQQLENLIRMRLPAIIEDLKEQAASVEADLSRLPPPPADNQHMLALNLVKEFAGTVTGYLSGPPSSSTRGTSLRNQFQKDLRDMTMDLKARLKHLRPRLQPLSAKREQAVADSFRSPARSWGNAPAGGPHRRPRQGSPTPRGGVRESIEIDSSAGEEEEEAMPAPVLGTPRKKRAREQLMPVTPSPKKPRVALVQVNHFNLPQIKNILESAATSRIPGQVAPEATKNLTKLSLQPWWEIIGRFLSELIERLQSFVRACMTECFHSYTGSPFFEQVFHFVERFFRTRSLAVENTVQSMFRWESELVATLSEGEFLRMRDAHLAILKEKRRRNLEEQRDAVERHGGGAEEGTPKGKKKPSPAQPAGATDVELNDPYKRELGVLAEVCAYHETACNRLVDYIYFCLQEEYVEHCKAKMEKELRNELGLDAPDADTRCRQLLVQDPEKEVLRQQLLLKKENLARASEQLHKC